MSTPGCHTLPFLLHSQISCPPFCHPALPVPCYLYSCLILPCWFATAAAANIQQCTLVWTTGVVMSVLILSHYMPFVLSHPISAYLLAHAVGSSHFSQHSLPVCLLSFLPCPSFLSSLVHTFPPNTLRFTTALHAPSTNSACLLCFHCITGLAFCLLPCCIGPRSLLDPTLSLVPHCVALCVLWYVPPATLTS